MWEDGARIAPDKVAVYIRWSTEDQGHGTTLAVQEEGCKHYILSQGWQVNAGLVFIDNGYTGSNLERPAMSDLRKAIRVGTVDCVVVFKLDRLSRSVLDTVNLVLHEWKGTCHLKSARETVDTTTPQGRMIFYVLVSFAEHERDVIRERMYSGRLRRAIQGRNPGRMIPYGFRKGANSGQVVVEPQKAAIVRRIYDEYLAGDGIRTICRRLNAEGGYGTQWQISKVQKLLDCPLYKGVLDWGAHEMTRGDDGKVRAVKRDKPTVAGVPFITAMPDGSPAEPIVAPDIWERAALARRQRATPGQNTRAAASPYLLTGLAKCQCGYALISIRRSRGAFYRCSRKHSGGTCDFRDVRQEVLDGQVMAYVRQLLPKAEVRGRLLEQAAREIDQARILAEAEDELASEGLRRLEAEDRRLNKDYRAGHLTIEEYRSFRRDVVAERDAHQRARENARRSLESLARLGTAEVEWEGLLLQWDAWDSLSRQEQKQVLRRFVKRLLVTHSHGQPPSVMIDLVATESRLVP